MCAADVRISCDPSALALAAPAAVNSAATVRDPCPYKAERRVDHVADHSERKTCDQTVDDTQHHRPSPPGDVVAQKIGQPSDQHRSRSKEDLLCRAGYTEGSGNTLASKGRPSPCAKKLRCSLPSRADVAGKDAPSPRLRRAPSTAPMTHGRRPSWTSRLGAGFKRAGPRQAYQQKRRRDGHVGYATTSRGREDANAPRVEGAGPGRSHDGCGRGRQERRPRPLMGASGKHSIAAPRGEEIAPDQ
jgi:hypothetical protein